MGSISISIHLATYGQYHIELSPDLTIDEIQEQLSTSYSEFADLSRHDVLIFAAQPSLGTQTLRELGLDSGSALFFVILKTATTLELSLPNESTPCVRIPAIQGRALVGRNDRDFTENLTLDLEPLLLKLERRIEKVSRGQAWFIFKETHWFVQPYEGAKAPVFVNGRQIAQGESVVLQDEDVVAFGNRQDDPVIQFIVRYSID